FAEDERLNRISIQEEVMARRDSSEGVNLDEELANMMMFQQAYNASARMMGVAREMFQTLLEAV
ncbi:MAG: flagellar basal body rod C-terminal domain-containing protein, partial [Alphaproteobacteria bacterium]